MPVRILYVITDLELGGVPLHLYRLAKATHGGGFDVSVAALTLPGPVADRLRDAGIEVLSCNAKGRWDLGVFSRLRKMIETRQPDIVHSLLFHANLAARLAARRAGLSANQVICEIQTVEVERRWHLRVDRWTYRRCRFTIGNSPSVVNHLHQHARIPQSHLRLVKGGINPAPYQQAKPLNRQTLGVAENVPVVLWVGRLDPVKGLPDLIEAFAEVRSVLDAHLLLAGSGPMHEQLNQLIDNRNLVERVHLLGPRHDIPSLLKTCNLFVFPSRTEGLPNALLEAMASQRPIVTTDVPGCRDLITHGQTGLVVPYGDTQALANAMKLLLEDPTYAAGLAANAARHVCDSWPIDATYAAYLEIYREMLPLKSTDHSPNAPT